MNSIKIVICAGVLALAISAQQDVRISVRELPPEPIPLGTCTQSHSGYLGVEQRVNGHFDISKEEIGEYVLSGIHQGLTTRRAPGGSFTP
jgi:hypothetical protein